MTVIESYCILQFLSMKLATVNPELNIDLDQIFSKDVSNYDYLKFFIIWSEIKIKYQSDIEPFLSFSCPFLLFRFSMLHEVAMQQQQLLLL